MQNGIFGFLFVKKVQGGEWVGALLCLQDFWQCVGGGLSIQWRKGSALPNMVHGVFLFVKFNFKGKKLTHTVDQPYYYDLECSFRFDRLLVAC